MQNNKTKIQLSATTMIYPGTGWFEMKEIKTKRVDVIAHVVEQKWITRYPLSSKIIIEKVEFMADFSDMIENDYGIEIQRIAT